MPCWIIELFTPRLRTRYTKYGCAAAAAAVAVKNETKRCLLSFVC